MRLAEKSTYSPGKGMTVLFLYRSGNANVHIYRLSAVMDIGGGNVHRQRSGEMYAHRPGPADRRRSLGLTGIDERAKYSSGRVVRGLLN